MTAAPEVVRYATRDELSAGSGARLVAAIVAAQRARGEAQVVLTGGSMGSAILAAAGRAPGHGGIAWDRVSLWWGDERFLPAGDPERNETQNRAALLDDLPLDEAKVHGVAPAGSALGETAEQAAADYTHQLAAAAGPDEGSPLFDIVLLGVGPDGHVASLFPGRPELDLPAPGAVAVHDSPKPPPDRVTMTFPVLRRAREVWLIVSGLDKAAAVARGVGGAELSTTPCAHVHGLERTVWLLDADAAAELDA